MAPPPPPTPPPAHPVPRPNPPPPPPSLSSCAVSRGRDLEQAGPGQGQAVRPRAQRTTGSAWAAPHTTPSPCSPRPPALTGPLLCSFPPAAAWCSLAQELQGEDDHEDGGFAQLGVPRQLPLAHALQGAASRGVGGRGSAGVGAGLESGLGPGLGVSWTHRRVGLRLSLGLGLSSVSRLISLGSRLSQNWGLAWDRSQGLKFSLGLGLSRGLMLSQSWDLARDRGSAKIQAQCLSLGSSLSLELGLFKDWDLEPGLGCGGSSAWVRGSIWGWD